jgi:hypothetical protein
VPVFFGYFARKKKKNKEICKEPPKQSKRLQAQSKITIETFHNNLGGIFFILRIKKG